MKLIKKPLHAYLWSLFIGIVTGGGLIFFSRYWHNEYLILYSDNLQINFFQALMIIVGFLLTFKLFVLVKLQEELYGDQHFLKDWAETFCSRDLTVEDYYKPLRNLSDLLVGCVTISVISAILQVTLGFHSNAYSISICLGSVGASLFLLITGFRYIKISLSDWFNVLENRDRSNVLKALEKAREEDPLVEPRGPRD